MLAKDGENCVTCKAEGKYICSWASEQCCKKVFCDTHADIFCKKTVYSVMCTDCHLIYKDTLGKTANKRSRIIAVIIIVLVLILLGLLVFAII